MKTNEQLECIAEKFTLLSNELPSNPFILCSSLQLSFKFKHELDKNDPYLALLVKSPACFVPTKTNGIIYLDSSSKYWRFYFFHEISHYILEHKINGINEEKEANMLACFLIAPPHLISKNIKNSNELSIAADIPIGFADEYWQYIKFKRFKKDRKKKYILAGCAAVLIFVGAIITTLVFKSTNTSKDIGASTSEAPALQTMIATYAAPTTSPTNPNSEIYYVTSSGRKYHTKDCRYIKNKTNLKEITNPEESGYEPCSVCIK